MGNPNFQETNFYPEQERDVQRLELLKLTLREALGIELEQTGGYKPVKPEDSKNPSFHAGHWTTLVGEVWRALSTAQSGISPSIQGTSIDDLEKRVNESLDVLKKDKKFE